MVRHLRQPALWWTLLLIWAGTLYWLSSRPGQPHEPFIPQFDKVLHFSYFFLGGILLQSALRLGNTTLTSQQLLWAGIAVAAIIGALDEYHQTFTPGRSGNDPFDWMADTLGGYVAARIAHWAASRKSSPPSS